MSSFAEILLESRVVVTESGKEIPLRDSIGKEFGCILSKLIEKRGSRLTLEIGMAHGISSLYICNAIKINGGNHVVIDPYQSDIWENVGVSNLNRAGLSDYCTFHEEFPESVLRDYIAREMQFDFCFIDGPKRFDLVFQNQLLIDRLLKKGGLLCFDDLEWPGVQKVCRYLTQHPNYEVYKDSELDFPKLSRRYIWRWYCFERVIAILMRSSKMARYLFNPSLADFEHGLLTSPVIFEKVNDREVPWDFYQNF